MKRSVDSPERIAELARTKRGTALCSLHHVIDMAWMREAFRLTRKDGAPGIDGATAEDFERNLEANLLDLLERIKMLWGLAAARSGILTVLQHVSRSLR